MGRERIRHGSRRAPERAGGRVSTTPPFGSEPAHPTPTGCRAPFVLVLVLVIGCFPSPRLRATGFHPPLVLVIVLVIVIGRFPSRSSSSSSSSSSSAVSPPSASPSSQPRLVSMPRRRRNGRRSHERPLGRTGVRPDRPKGLLCRFRGAGAREADFSEFGNLRKVSDFRRAGGDPSDTSDRSDSRAGRPAAAHRAHRPPRVQAPNPPPTRAGKRAVPP